MTFTIRKPFFVLFSGCKCTAISTSKSVFLKPGVETHLCVIKIIQCVAKNDNSFSSSKKCIYFYLSKMTHINQALNIFVCRKHKSGSKGVAAVKGLRTTPLIWFIIQFQETENTLELFSYWQQLPAIQSDWINTSKKFIYKIESNFLISI